MSIITQSHVSHQSYNVSPEQRRINEIAAIRAILVDYPGPYWENRLAALEEVEGCSCNGTEAVACAYCREQAKTQEIPF